MMGERQVQQGALFYEFSLERHEPAEHLLRSIDRYVELDGVRRELAPFYSEVGRPSLGPVLIIRMLIVGYCHTQRTPAGEIDRPRRFNASEMRTWPQAGCSIASATTASS